MKILHAFDFFSPHGGGSVSFLHDLTQAIARRGHQVSVYTSDFKLDREYISSMRDVKVYPFRCVSSLGLFYITPSLVPAVRDNLKSFDVVHLHCVRSYQNIVIHHYARKYGIPYLVDAHGSLPRAAAGKKDFKLFMRWMFDVIFGNRILRDASLLIAETKLGISEYRQYGVPDDKIVLIPPPFPIEDFAVLPPRGLFRDKFSLKDKKIVMFLGRINWIKGIDFLVDGFNQLARNRNDIRLVIVGNDDGFKSSLMSQITRLNLTDKVIFTGFLVGNDKLSALVDADVVIQTSRYEQGAWAPFEAVLCGTPIIVSDNSGAGEDVKKINAGYLVPFGNEKTLADMIEYVIKNASEAKAKTVKAGDYIKQNLSMTKEVEKYEEAYKAVTEGRKK